MSLGLLFLRLLIFSKTEIGKFGRLVQMQLANLLSIVSDGDYYNVCQVWGLVIATFHDIIRGAVPQVVDLLKDNILDVQSTSANAIGKLAEKCKW
jgi:hypothetical protein